jgi:hypothetical protein
MIHLTCRAILIRLLAVLWGTLNSANILREFLVVLNMQNRRHVEQLILKN